MPPHGAPIDEVAFNSPEAIPAIGLGPTLNSENILYYFYHCAEFFDTSSINYAFIELIKSGRAPDAAELMPLLYNRRDFERVMQEKYPVGRQYLVVSEPQAPHQPWVIQQQNRHYKSGSGAAAREIVTDIEATFFTIGTSIVRTPNLLDVMRARMLSVTELITSAVEIAQSLTHFSPATGHTYMPPSYKSSKPTAEGASTSRAGSIAPTDMADSQLSATAHQQTAATAAPTTDAQTTDFYDPFFLRSLDLTSRFGTEFMDENPLQGEPGAFVYASTNQHVEARNKAAAAAQAAPGTGPGTASGVGASLTVPVKGEEGGSATSSAAPTPRPVPSEAPAPSRKGSVVVGAVPKPRRRKSKGLTSPTSPTG